MSERVRFLRGVELARKGVSFLAKLLCFGAFWGMIPGAWALQVPLARDVSTSGAFGQTAMNFNSGSNAGVLQVDGRPGQARRAWMKFDLSAVLSPDLHWSEVSKATLTVYINQLPRAGSIRVEAVRGPWNEFLLTHASAPASMPDPAGVPYAKAEVAEVSKFVSLDVTELVRDWVEGLFPNHGLVVLAADGVVRMAFDSKESTSTSHPPVLEINLRPGNPAGVWHHGAGEPDRELGEVGDFYFDTKGVRLFGPKNASGWGAAFSLEGPRGISGRDGQDGSRWWSGVLSPGVETGRLGDFYLNLTDARYYGPKTAEGWGEGYSLRGSAGPVGPAGLQGLRGEPGPAGAKGEKGEPGAVGPRGEKGEAGPAGAQGIRGELGPQGLRGERGEKGDVGPVGAQGSRGETGPAGVNGRSWVGGQGVPGRESGGIGDLYLDVTSGMVFGPKSDQGWGQAVSLIGPKGEKGARGNGWLSGVGEPQDEEGEDGDFYLEEVGARVWGPKRNGSWGVVRFSMRGIAGPKGETGGVGIPAYIEPQGDISMGVYTAKPMN